MATGACVASCRAVRHKPCPALPTSPRYVSPHVELPVLVASFGASAVLLFGTPDSKLAQPRHFLGEQAMRARARVGSDAWPLEAQHGEQADTRTVLSRFTVQAAT